MGYSDDDMRKLEFSQIECITIIDRKVIAIDTDGNHYSLKDRLRDLEDIEGHCRVSSKGHTFVSSPTTKNAFADAFCKGIFYFPYYSPGTELWVIANICKTLFAKRKQARHEKTIALVV